MQDTVFPDFQFYGLKLFPSIIFSFAGWEAMAANKTHSGLILKAKRKLTDALLQIPQEIILQESDSHLLLTKDEYFSLSQVKDPKELVETLIDLVLRKKDPAQEQFLDCLENLQQVFPTLQPIASYLEDGECNTF